MPGGILWKIYVSYTSRFNTRHGTVLVRYKFYLNKDSRESVSEQNSMNEETRSKNV